MITVSDTTAITTLLKAGQEGLLQKLFGSVIVPQAVWDELSVFHPRLPGFLFRQSVSARMQRLAGTELLGLGEAEAIQLAKEIPADLLLTDDRKARTAASGLGIRCAGVLAVLLDAKAKGHLHSVRAAIEEIEKKGGLYLSNSVKNEALKFAGEQ